MSNSTSFTKGHGFVDLTGQRFGRWIAIRFVVDELAKSPAVKYRWEARCDCGTVRTVSQSSLRSGSSRSCGCLKVEVARQPRLPEGLSQLRRFIQNCRRSADIRHLRWELTEDQVLFLIQQPCHYCGLPPSQIQGIGAQTREWHFVLKYTGIDRRDNNVGYVFENCLPCCKTCNWMKGEMGYEAFLLHIQRILEYLPRSA
jgi:hypothetical protein